MNKLLNILPLVLLTLIIASCSSDEPVAKDPGTMAVLFENKLGDRAISIKDAGDRSFDYTDAGSQSYNISRYGYYISAIELEGEEGIKHVDPLNVAADASLVKGYYHVKSSEANSNLIQLSDIPAGKYNKIRFTVGVAEAGVQEGAAGGVLDPANGAWFWNWNAGYIGFGVEGNASNSGQEYVDWGNGFITAEGSYALHVGGWKDIEPQEGEDPKFVNNVRVIEMDFDAAASIEDGLNPKVHINVNFDKVLEGIDFSTQYAIHRPDLGKPFADRLAEVFVLDHVHQ